MHILTYYNSCCKIDMRNKTNNFNFTADRPKITTKIRFTSGWRFFTHHLTSLRFADDRRTLLCMNRHYCPICVRPCF